MTEHSPLKRILLAVPVLALFAAAVWFGGGAPEAVVAPQARAAFDKQELAARAWPMYGGSNARNMANTVERNLPAEWDVESGKNVKWAANLGTQAYGGPIVAGGKIYVGTNRARDPKVPGDKGVILCFREADGKFLWQSVHDKLESGRVNDWPEQGICSSPFVEGNRVYYVSNRCELICADTEGMADGNQGVQDEKYKGPEHADIIWRLDMIKDLGVFPHNLAVCSPVIVGDLVFIVTGNGHDESHENIPAPQAPSFICVNKADGKVVWKDNSPGTKILHGQWSNPAYAVVGGKAQAIFAGGDGWVRAFDPASGKELWKFDCNLKSAVYKLGGRGTRNYIIGTPVVYKNHVYISTGQDPEHGDGVGHFWCIDPTKSGDVSPVKDNLDPKAPENQNSALVWHYGGADANGELKWHRTMSTCAIHDDRCYLASTAGFIICADAKTGKVLWDHDALSNVWGSCYVVDGKVFVGTEEGDVLVFADSAEKKLLGKIDMKAPVLSTPVACNGVLYVMTKNKLYAISNVK